MRILFTSEATGWCGGANQIWLTATRLIARGHAIAVACRKGFELSNRLEKSGVPVIDFWPKQDYSVFAARKLARLAKDWGARLVHAHHPRAHAAALLATFVGLAAPVVVTRRVIYPVGRNPFSRLKYSSARVGRYIAVCDEAAEALVNGGVDRRRVIVIPSGVDMGRWDKPRLARPALEARRPYVVTMVGHRSPAKGHEIMLKAAALLERRADIRFQLAGRGTESLRAGSNVELLGERHDVPELLAVSHLYAMPSLQEGIGTALIEAQAGLVPVVASRVGGLPQVVEDGVTGVLVQPGDPEALARAILGQLDDGARARRMALAGYERVRARFSIDAAVDRLEKVYQSLA